MKLFAKRFYGFNPEVFPIVTFSQAGSRSSLLSRASKGDRILYVAVKGEQAKPELRGKILGMAEFSRDMVNSEDFIISPESLPANYYDERGFFRWPQGIPIIKAWRFVDPPLLTDIMPQLDQSARSNAVLLDGDITEKILRLPSTEVEIPETTAARKLNARNDALSSNISQEWKYEINSLAKRVLKIASQANGQEIISHAKVKNCNLKETDLELLLRSIYKRQKGRCALTGRVLELSQSGNKWLRASVDRIDSDGDYEEENIQITSWAANRAKGNLPYGEEGEFFSAIQIYDDNE